VGAESAQEAAWGVIQVANANIERAIRRISVERGYDPRYFTLVAFGGAGPLHACDLAQGMGIPQVLIPPSPGVLSALGMLVANPARDYSITVMGQIDGRSGQAAEWLVSVSHTLVSQATTEMSADGYDPDSLELDQRLDMRYLGQSHELTVRVSPGASQEQIAVAFHRAHDERYGFNWPEKPVQIVNLRLTARAPEEGPTLPEIAAGHSDSQAAMIGHKMVWFGERALDSRLYDRTKLQAGNRIVGPAIVFQYDTTTVVPPEWVAEVDGTGNLLIKGEAE
jgi:N-methylhydantoinase A